MASDTNSECLPSASSTCKVFKVSNSRAKDNLVVLSKVLTWLGIDTSEKAELEQVSYIKKIIGHLYPLFLFVTAVDMMAMFAIEYGMYREDAIDTKVNSAHIVESIIAVCLWISLYFKRSALKTLLDNLSVVSDVRKPNLIYIVISFVINLLIILGYICVSIYMVYSTEDGNEYCAFYYYRLVDSCHHGVLHYLFVFMKTVSMCCGSTFFCCMISIIFCVICCRCSAMLSKYRDDTENIILMESFSLLQPSLSSKYTCMCSTIRQVQQSFSFASFSVLLANFIQAFILLGSCFKGIKMSSLDIIESVFTVAPSFVLCLLVPACAAQISIEMQKNQEVFGHLYEIIVFRSGVQFINIKVAKVLKQTLIITLSAWDMTSFSSSVLPAVIGTLLTYGLLILNIDKQ